MLNDELSVHDLNSFTSWMILFLRTRFRGMQHCSMMPGKVVREQMGYQVNLVAQKMFKGIPWAKPNPLRKTAFSGNHRRREFFRDSGRPHKIAWRNDTKLWYHPGGGDAPGNTKQVPILAAQYSPNFHKKKTAKRTSSNQTWNSCPYHPLFLVKWSWHRCNLILWSFCYDVKTFSTHWQSFTQTKSTILPATVLKTKEKAYPIFYECPIFYSTIVDLM